MHSSEPMEGKVSRGPSIPVDPCLPYFYMPSPMMTEDSRAMAVDYKNTLFSYSSGSQWEVSSISFEGMREKISN